MSLCSEDLVNHWTYMVLLWIGPLEECTSTIQGEIALEKITRTILFLKIYRNIEMIKIKTSHTWMKKGRLAPHSAACPAKRTWRPILRQMCCEIHLCWHFHVNQVCPDIKLLKHELSRGRGNVTWRKSILPLNFSFY